MKTYRRSTSLLFTLFALALSISLLAACGSKGDKKSADDLSEDELFERAYSAFPKMVAAAEKHAGDCDKIASAWKKAFVEISPLIDRVKKIEASDAAKKAKYEAKYNEGVMKFAQSLGQNQEKCKDNKNFQEVIKLMK